MRPTPIFILLDFVLDIYIFNRTSRRQFPFTGFNERLRFYRYQGEQYFKWHRDGSYASSLYEESHLNFIIYLNDDFEEGYTEFEKTKIYPQAGTALVFPHMLLHNAVSARNGTKYVLRTDVMYSLK